MSLSDNAALNAILVELKIQNKPGSIKFSGTDIRTLSAAATFQSLYTTPKNVNSAVIQNLSTEDVTIVTQEVPTPTAGEGIILNAANAAGEGGGTLSAGSVDLAKFKFVRTNTGVTLSVYWESLEAPAS